MKNRHIILSLLLSAFLFVAFHDFVMGYYDADTQVELSSAHIKTQPLCGVSKVHEIIHNSMIFCDNSNRLLLTANVEFSPYFLVDSQPFKPLQQNIYRPPIA